MEVLYVVAALIAVCSLVAAGRLWQWSIQANERLRRLEETKPQPAKRLDNTVSQNAAFEDALAVVMRVLIEEDAQAEYRKTWILKLQGMLQTARAGPHAYPVDQPSGNGISKRRVTYSDSVEQHFR